LALAGVVLPDDTRSRAERLEFIQSRLPSYEYALYLCKAFLEKVGWFVGIVTTDQLLDEMLPSIYGGTLSAPSADYSGPHHLALVFSALSIGALADQKPTEPDASDAHLFIKLSKAALGLQSVFEKPTLSTVQALHMQGVYHAMIFDGRRKGATMETAWGLIGQATQVACAVSDATNPDLCTF
jgi:hypothetical protein